jgi:hypothetical protein
MRRRAFPTPSRASILGDEIRRVKRECDVAARRRAQIKNRAPRPGGRMSCEMSHAYLRTYTLAMVAALVVGAHAAVG